MKNIQKHIKKISKTTIKKGATALMFLFFAMAILFQKDVQKIELQFVWNMDETFLHEAPNTQRDYLFQNDEWQTTYQWTLTWTTPIIPIHSNQLITTEDIEKLLQELQPIPEPTATGMIFTGDMITEPQTTGSLDCITPRWEEVKNKDFILAYEQRKDVNIICNIEKRVCMSGTLLWSFPQRSCREDIVYNYQKAEVVSYNQKVLNEYIQPLPPENRGAEFDSQGKIGTTEQPTTTRGTSNGQTTTSTSANQTREPRKAQCRAPRWQIIEHGQFTKAYKSPRGFIDLPCEVEIRACTDGALRGNFRYATCTFNNTTYDEYIAAGSPAINTGFLFFQRIKKIFSL